MGDIDFDELDKAVSSLMGSVPKQEQEDVRPDKTLSISSTLKPDEKPAYDKLEAVAKTIGNETLVTAGERTVLEDLDNKNASATDKPTAAPPPPKPLIPAPKKPSSGRFMDVVHPSSDMKTASSSPALVVPSRESGPAVPPAVSSTPPLEPVLAPVHAEPVQVERAPLTPFLPDAKVEKRPLGGPTTPGKYEEPETNPAEEKALEIAEIESINSEPIAKDTLESDEQRPFDAEKLDDKPSPVDKTLQSIEASEIEESSPAISESVRAVESGDTEKMLQHSALDVPQVAGKTDETDANIFDVKDYHQSLVHPAKQKSGWGVVIIIAIIIILSAAVAGGAYFFLVMKS